MVEFVAGRKGATKARDVNWEELRGMAFFGVGLREYGVRVVPFHGANVRRDGPNGDLVGHLGGRVGGEIGGSQGWKSRMELR